MEAGLRARGNRQVTPRDELSMQVLGFRQLLYDMPASAIPQAVELLKETERQLVDLAKECQPHADQTDSLLL